MEEIKFDDTRNGSYTLSWPQKNLINDMHNCFFEQLAEMLELSGDHIVETLRILIANVTKDPSDLDVGDFINEVGCDLQFFIKTYKECARIIKQRAQEKYIYLNMTLAIYTLTEIKLLLYLL